MYENLKERIKNILNTNAETPLEEPVPKRPKKRNSYVIFTRWNYSCWWFRWLFEGTTTVDKNGLEWWENNQDLFPTVAELVKQYFTVRATSVSSEQIFSMAGLIVNQQQSSLKPDNVDINYAYFNKNL